MTLGREFEVQLGLYLELYQEVTAGQEQITQGK